VYNAPPEAVHCVLSNLGASMSKFVQVSDSPNPEYALMLNLDHVSKVQLSPEISFDGVKRSEKVYLTLFGMDGYETKKLDFETRDMATRWVLQHLGVELN
jgi:hypothetical protein